MNFQTLNDLSLTGKNVLTRVDINVPMEGDIVTDTTRIDRIVPTIKTILEKGGRPVLMAHFGRPKGQVVPEMSLRRLIPALENAFGAKIEFVEDLESDLSDQPIVLLENTRFHEGETTNDLNLAKKFARFGEIYCNDAFSTAHRAHASTAAVASLLPSCAGLLMEAELNALDKALSRPERPLVGVIGGAKVSTKLNLLGNLIPKMDKIIIGGGMANTFLAAKGFGVGKSLCENDLIPTAKEILAQADKADCELVLPTDVVVATEFAENAPNKVVDIAQCPTDMMILDAGPQTIEHIKSIFADANTVVWNGPLGAFEIQPFNKATDEAAKTAASLSLDGSLTTVAGGGDTVAALNSSDSAKDFTYISTAGGAFLEWLEGKSLPGIAALSNEKQ